MRCVQGRRATEFSGVLVRRRHRKGARCARPQLPSHSSTSVRNHPIGRPRNCCFFGNLPINVRAVRIHRWRRVSRATSCEVRTSLQAGSRSLTQRESGTSAAATEEWRTVRRREWSIHMARLAHDVWFRWLRDELSLRRQYEPATHRRNEEYRRIFDGNPSGEVRASSDLQLKSDGE